ncbi:uncharacterized protein LOC143451938 [Clavelina lepadiformis]|uniref:uncharacterized protein LOC143451938 n=1 Tax=Clavelina lepadiformis TaxID=159417 RepID=UPI004042E95A
MPFSNSISFTPATTNLSNGSDFVLDGYGRNDWILPIVVNSVLLLLTIWIIISLIDHGIRTEKWSLKRRDELKLSSGIVYTSTIVNAFLALARFVASMVSFQVAFQDYCENAEDAAFYIYGFSTFSVHLFLWLRQRIFYTNSMLGIQFNVLLKILSAISIVLIFGAGLIVILLINIPSLYKPTPEGCTYKPSPEMENNLFKILLVGALLVILGQLIMVGLFIYPLQIVAGTNESCFSWQSIWKSSNISESGESRSTVMEVVSGTQPSMTSNVGTVRSQSAVPDLNKGKSGKRKRSSKTVRQVIGRTVILQICLITVYILRLVVTNFALEKYANRRVYNTLTDLNVFIDLMLIILSYTCCKEMFVSPILRCMK